MQRLCGHHVDHAMLGRPCLVELQIVLVLVACVSGGSENTTAMTSTDVWEGVGFASAQAGKDSQVRE